MDDGCGKTLDCGSCASGFACAASGSCVQVLQPGDVEWIYTEPGVLTAIAADTSSLFFLSPKLPNDTTIARISSDGTKAWSVTSPYPLRDIGAHPAADALVVAGFEDETPECGYGCPNQVTLRYSKAGSNPTLLATGTPHGSSYLLATSAAGSQIWARFLADREIIEVRHTDGNGFDVEIAWQPHVALDAAAFDAAGNVFLAGNTIGVWSYRNQSFGSGDHTERHPLLLKLSPTGEIIWGNTLTVSGRLFAVRVSGSDTPVALLEAEAAFTFANQPRNAAGELTVHVLVWAADGTERAAMADGPGFFREPFARHLAVDSSGNAFIAAPADGMLRVSKYGLSGPGSIGWSRTFAVSDSVDPYRPSFTGIEVIAGAPVISGTLSGTATFGSLTRTSNAESIYVVKLKP